MEDLDKVKANNQQFKKKERIKTIFKFVLISLILIISFVYKYFKDGLYESIKTMIILLACIVGGVLLFFGIYYLIYLITFIKITKENKEKVEELVVTEEDIKEYIDSGKYTFNYDKNLQIKENLIISKDLALSLIKDIFEKYNKENKYFLFDYTVYDALDIIERTVILLYSKIDKIISSIGLQNTQLKFISKIISDKIEGEEKEKTIFDKIKDKIKNYGIKTATVLFRKQINDCINSIIIYTGIEAKKLYSKNKKERENKLIVSEVKDDGNN